MLPNTFIFFSKDEKNLQIKSDFFSIPKDSLILCWQEHYILHDKFTIFTFPRILTNNENKMHVGKFENRKETNVLLEYAGFVIINQNIYWYKSDVTVKKPLDDIFHRIFRFIRVIRIKYLFYLPKNNLFAFRSF